MASTLVINHHSLLKDNCVADSFAKSCEYLNEFFNTWRHAIDRKICTGFIACDTEIWSWELGEDKTMHDFAERHKLTEKRLIYELLKITKKSSLDFFDDEIIEVVTSNDNKPLLEKQSMPLLGCACLSDDAITLSLKTSKIWEQPTFSMRWVQTKSYHLLHDTCDNFSTIEHVDTYYETLQNQLPITQELFENLLPNVFITPPFWDWFCKLDKNVQYFLVEKAQFCASGGWLTRESYPYKTLQNTKNSLTELRAWPVGKTLRIYIKKKSNQEIIFLGGSDKSTQNDALHMADDYCSKNH